MADIFNGKFGGIADSKYSGIEGSFYRSVGIDGHSTPGLLKVHQKLSKHSSTTITELCKKGIACSDGSKIWFSSESGKIWREVSGVYTLIHTVVAESEPFSSARQYTKLVREGNQKWTKTDTASLSVASDCSFVAYVYFRSLPADGEVFTLFDKWTTSGNQRSYKITIENTVTETIGYFGSTFANTYTIKLYTCIDGAAGTVSVMTYTWPAPKIATWYNIGVVRDRDVASGTVKFYINGAEVGSTVDQTGDNALFDSTAIFTIGGSATDSDVSFDGYITDARMWSRALSGADMTSLYADPVAFANGANIISHWKFTGNGTDELATNTLTNSGTATFATFGATIAVIPLDGEEYDSYIYFAIKDRLSRILVANIGSTWSSNVEVFGFFANADDTYHPFAKQNNELFIGDKYVIAKVTKDTNSIHTFVAETDLDIAQPERITALAPYDIDLLIGTLNVNKARVLRWDTVGTSWGTEDDIAEAGVKAFLRDDNYVYVLVGDYGRWFFYNGEKCEPYFKIPGAWSPSAKAVVNHNAVGFLLGLPIFGLSNSTGNPALQGVYSFGSYDKHYTKVLDLSYVISSDETSGMTIGAIIVDGADLYVAWKGATTVGVDKLDYTAKYASAYIESRNLFEDQRDVLKTVAEIKGMYESLPASTGLTFSYSVNSAAYVAMTDVDDTKLAALVASLSIEAVGSFQVKIAFDVSANTAPAIQRITADLTQADA